jgi:hypothetical protein
MRKRDGFGKILVQLHGFTNGAGDLRDFQGMRQSGTVIIPFMIDKYLGLIFQPTKSGRMDHPVAVALKTGPVRMLFLIVLPARAFATFDGVRDQRLLFHLLDVLAIDQTLIPLKGCYRMQANSIPILANSTPLA